MRGKVNNRTIQKKLLISIPRISSFVVSFRHLKNGRSVACIRKVRFYDLFYKDRRKRTVRVSSVL